MKEDPTTNPYLRAKAEATQRLLLGIPEKIDEIRKLLVTKLRAAYQDKRMASKQTDRKRDE
jgi:hypothetical protein